MVEYRRRFADLELRRSLEAFGAVLIEGPKWCGKTTTAEQASKSVLYLQDPDKKEEYSTMMKVKPSYLLEGGNPRLIDEWQMAPQLWDAVRFKVDQARSHGLFILTGSTSVDESSISHSGAGRIVRMRMGTMSLAESGDSSGDVALEDLFEQKEIVGRSNLSVEDLSSILVRGGWPESVGRSESVAREHIKGYCNTILRSDIVNVDGKSRNPELMAAIMRSFSRSISAPVADTKIASDVCEKDNYEVHLNTVKDYLGALKRLFVIDDLPAWTPKLRSKSTVRLSDVRHFCDPAIACYFLGASPKNLLEDLNTFGLLFESMAIRDLRAYASAIGGRVYHYHDNTGLEADAIVTMPDGSWGAIEVKLGHGMIDDAAANLLKLRDKVDTSEHALRFLAVVTGTELAYRRDDGVYVVPLGCLTARFGDCD